MENDSKKMFNFDSVLSRVKLLLNTESDKDVAAAIGMKPNTFHMRKKNNSIPLIEFVTLSDSKKVNMNWLVYGEGPIYKDKKSESENKQKYASSSELKQKDSLTASDTAGLPSITELITKTIEILESETVYSGALSANIEAFHEATKTEQKFRELQADMEDRFNKMENRISILETENYNLRNQLDDSTDNGSGMAANEG